MAERVTLPLTSGMVNGEDGVIPGYISPLELLHPDGVAKRSIVIGSNCPALLLLKSSTAGESADLVLLAPTIAECRTSGWLEEAAQSVAQMLASDGVAYVLAPPRWRLRIISLLRHQGLLIGPLIAHLPDWTSNRYLVPLNPIPAWYAFSKLIPTPFLKRCLAMLAFSLPGGEKLLASMLPSIGLVIRRPGGRPLFNWLFQLGGEFHLPGSVVISTKWRGQSGTAVLHRFSGHGALPSAVAKMNLTTKALGNPIREAEMLDRLGPGARNAGAQVPQSLSLEHLNECPVLLETVISGQSCASLLTSQPNRLVEFIDRLMPWLESWNRSTLTIGLLDREFLEKELLTAATLVTPLIEHGEEYRNWLIQCCLTVAGAPATFIATHNDLTTSNILLGEQEHLGVIDWESASEKGLPFVDFFYAVTDVVTVAKTNGDRLKAFNECFAVGGTFEGIVSQYLARLRRVVQISDEMVGLCFHTCWLHHARNEYRSTGPSDPRPFLQLVQWLSLNRPNLCHWVHG